MIRAIAPVSKMLTRHFYYAQKDSIMGEWSFLKLTALIPVRTIETLIRDAV